MCCIWPHVNHLWETISSLRFASRMRCIENHPQRNSLTNGNASVSSSTRSLQLKIESLKKELIMRDMMCGYAMYSHSSPQSDSLGRTPILDTLSQPQLNSCQKMASRYILSGAEKDIDIRSLVEMRTILNIMRTMIWNSCGGDLANVERLLKESSPENGDNVADFMSRATPRHDNQPQSHPIDPISEASNEEGDGEPFNPAKEHESSTSGRNEASPTLPNNRHDPFIPIPTNPDLVESSSVAGEDSDPFELFKKGKGKELHQAYESLKFDLKEAKNRQKALVKEVNQTKIEIDALSGHIQNLEISSPRPAEEIADQQSTLSELKAQYKQRRNDLISLKEEILDLNRRKQLALNALVSGYEDYVQARKEQGQEQRDYAVNPDAFESLIVDDLLRQRGGKSSVSPS